MKKWPNKIRIRTKLYDVVEHTDKEVNKPRNDGQFLAPISCGFVCLYLNGKYTKWCGVNYAKKRIIK